MSVTIIPHDKFFNRKPSQDIHNTYNVNVGDNSHINAIGANNAIDSSSNSFSSVPAELFEQTRMLIENLNSSYKQDMLNILSQIEQAKASENKNECANSLGHLISLASIADCITVAQPIFHALEAWLFS